MEIQAEKGLRVNFYIFSLNKGIFASMVSSSICDAPSGA